MNRHQMLRLLIEHGFAEVRKVRHGTLWRNSYGDSVILDRPGTKDPRAIHNWKQVFKRIEKRKAAENET